MNLAPVVLFVYNRPWHTKQTIETLQKNSLAQQSKLFIYSDAPKDKSEADNVKQVRKHINNLKGFKKIIIVERDRNWGLADSIIDGVSSIIEEYGKIIVLEDDIVTSQYFLKFMNDALNYYENEQKVWHVSGWNYPINSKSQNNAFLWRLMNCWGWATWADRWQYFNKDADSIINSFSKSDIHSFNIDGCSDFWYQVTANKENKINTWAIFWYASIFKQEGLCLNPSVTFVNNIGHDGSGENCSKSPHNQKKLNQCKNIEFTDSISESTEHLEKVKKTMNRSIYARIKRRLFCRY